VLDQKVSELRSLGYERLQSMNSTKFSLFGGRLQLGGGPSELAETHGPSGILYQLETEVMWDDHTGGTLRVLVTLFEECLATRTLREDFIVGPDNRAL
jgi:hypothetical protein